MECRISCEFLLRNFLLFAHATMFEQNNLNQIWKFSNKHFLFNFRFALRTRCVFQFSQHFNFMVKHDESLFRLKLFPSRVGWEGFAPFMTEKFSSFPPFALQFLPTLENLFLWSKKATPFGPEGRKVLKLSPMKKSVASDSIGHVVVSCDPLCEFCFANAFDERSEIILKNGKARARLWSVE